MPGRVSWFLVFTLVACLSAGALTRAQEAAPAAPPQPVGASEGTHPAAPPAVREVKPDVLVVATGAVPVGLNVPGATGENVVQGHDVIAGRAVVKDKAVVVGGRFIGMEVAIMLAELGRPVSLVTQAGLGEDGIRLEPMNFRALARKLIELRVPLYLHSRVVEITGRKKDLEAGLRFVAGCLNRRGIPGSVGSNVPCSGVRVGRIEKRKHRGEHEESHAITLPAGFHNVD